MMGDFAAFFEQHDAERDAAWQWRLNQIAEELSARVSRQQGKALRRLRRAWASDGSNRNHIPDKTVLSLNQGSGTGWAEVIAAPAHQYDPVRLAEAALVRELLGDVDEEDIARMDDQALGVLQRRLIAEGFGPGLVQRRERERLREPLPHRGGGAPSSPTERIGTGSKRKRREVERAKHSRSARKPRSHRDRRKAKDGWL